MRSGMMESSAKSRVLNKLPHMSKRVGVILLGTFLVLAVAGWIRMGLEEATKVHWSVGLTAASVLFFLMLFGLWWIWRQPLATDKFGIFPRIGLFLNLMFVAVPTMVAMATISDLFRQQNWVQYTSNHPITLPLIEMQIQLVSANLHE